MAIDTPAKRRGAAGAGLLWGAFLPRPDHSIDAQDRWQLAGFYPRVAVLAFAIGTKLHDATNSADTGAVLAVSARPGLLIEISGGASKTIAWEGRGTSGQVRPAVAVNMTTLAIGTTTSTDGFYAVSSVGLESLQARVSSYTSGDVTVTVREVLPLGVMEWYARVGTIA